MLKFLQARRDASEEGFTLIELMIVVVIIGILAAIAIPIFANQQKEAIIAGIKSDVKNLNTSLVTVLAKDPTATEFSYNITSSSATGTLIGTDKIGIVSLSDPANALKIRSATSLTGNGSWNNYMVIGWNTELGLAAYRYSFNSTTGAYFESRN